jgi:hypothetical protein
MSSGSTRGRNAIAGITIYACVWGYFVAQYFVERDDSLIILSILGLPLNAIWLIGALSFRDAPAAGVQAALMLIFGGIQYGIVGWFSGRRVARKEG